MSNIRSLEPQAHGLIIFKTTFGDLELELFTQQCPKVTKNFVQLCLDNYYQGTIFDRIEKDFIAIGGKIPEGKEDDIEFDIAPDEFHTRLKFSRRGLLATANTGRNANGPAFFFTLGPAQELQNKHTIFGRLKGDSLYRLVDLNECPVDDDMLPISEKKILQVIVVDNPYPELRQRPQVVKSLGGSRSKPESEDTQSEDISTLIKPRIDLKYAKKLSFLNESDDDDDDEDGASNDESSSKGRNFEMPRSRETQDQEKANHDAGCMKSSSPEEQNSTDDVGSKSSKDDRERRLREIREQIRSFKKQLENESATKIKTLSERKRSSQDQESQHNTTLESRASSSKQSSIDEPDMTAQELRLAAKKGRQRERETLELMDRFKKKLKETTRGQAHPSMGSSKRGVGAEGARQADESDVSEDEDQHLDHALNLVDGDNWLRHRFDAESNEEILAKDANTKGDDWYSIDDPRNPMMNRIEAERAREYSDRSRRKDKYQNDSDGERDNNHRDSHTRHRHYRSSSSRRSESRGHHRDKR